MKGDPPPLPPISMEKESRNFSIQIGEAPGRPAASPAWPAPHPAAPASSPADTGSGARANRTKARTSPVPARRHARSLPAAPAQTGWFAHANQALGRTSPVFSRRLARWLPAGPAGEPALPAISSDCPVPLPARRPDVVKLSWSPPQRLFLSLEYLYPFPYLGQS